MRYRTLFLLCSGNDIKTCGKASYGFSPLSMSVAKCPMLAILVSKFTEMSCLCAKEFVLFVANTLHYLQLY